MTSRPGPSHLTVSFQLCRQFGAISALVYAYMRAEAQSQGGVYTGSQEQLAAALSLPGAALSESLQQLEAAQLLRDTTPDKGPRAHAFLVRPPR